MADHSSTMHSRSTGHTPTSQTGIGDAELLERSESIGSNPSSIRRLGHNLGFTSVQVDGFVRTNTIQGVYTTEGTYQMLHDWRERTPVARQRRDMASALRRAECIPEESTSNYNHVYWSFCLGVAIFLCFIAILKPFLFKDHVSEALTDIGVSKCREDLIQYYLNEVCKIKTSPLDIQNFVQFDDIFINLKLASKGNPNKKKMDMPYEDILTTKNNGILPVRMAFVGEAGIGKTTLLSKIAYDWATGKRYRDITLLLLVFLRDIETVSTLGEIASARMSDDNKATAEQINTYIKENPKKVLVLLDGLDELPITSSERKYSDIVKIIEYTLFKSGRVIITSRPSAMPLITSVTKLSKVYAVVEVEGFKQEQVVQYVNKYFPDNGTAANGLVQFMEEDGGLLAENMTSYPFFCAILCNMWRIEERRDTIMKLQTFFQLFDALVYHLKEHFLVKSEEDREFLDFEEVDKRFTQIGKKAFDGLLENQLSFDKKAFEGLEEAVERACEVGILTKEKRLAPEKVRRKTGMRNVEVISFPHKLLQEFFASIYLASIHRKDPTTFKAILTSNLTRDYWANRYVLYFIVGQSENQSEISSMTMKALMRKSAREDFIVDMAFECHDKDITKPFTRNLLAGDPAIDLHDRMKTHTISGFLFAMETFKELEMVRFKNIHFGKTLSQLVASALFSHPPDSNMRKVIFSGTTFHQTFFTEMIQCAPNSKIETVEHSDSEIKPEWSEKYAVGLGKMRRLRHLELSSVIVPYTFYEQIASSSAMSQIQNLTLRHQTISPPILHAILSMRALRSLVFDQVILNRRHQPGVSQNSTTASHVRELVVEDKSLHDLVEFGLTNRCPEVTKVVLHCHRYELTTDVIDCLRFPEVTELRIEGSKREDTSLENPRAISDSLANSWTKLENLTISQIPMTEDDAEEIMLSARAHGCLKMLTFDGSIDSEDTYIQELRDKINEEGRVKINIIPYRYEEYDEEEYEYAQQESPRIYKDFAFDSEGEY